MKTLAYFLIFISPKYAYSNAQQYWEKTEKTHRNMNAVNFENYYQRISQIITPTKNDVILDAGCGSGEITQLFHESGYNIKGFDSSPKLIDKAKRKKNTCSFYIDSFIDMKTKHSKYSKIIINNAFFYVHPKKYQQVLINLYDILLDGGKLYLLDNPDYRKRKLLYKNNLIKIAFTSVFPIYDVNNSGFWIKWENIEKIGTKVGFSKVINLDSSNYRSDIILEKGRNFT
jgi:SAM-dependent methyltransferase